VGGGKVSNGKKKLDEGQGRKKIPKQKMILGLRKGKKIKSTCQPPWLTQGPKKIALMHHPSSHKDLKTLGPM
jgi:hypothetical protein